MSDPFLPVGVIVPEPEPEPEDGLDFYLPPLSEIPAIPLDPYFERVWGAAEVREARYANLNGVPFDDAMYWKEPIHATEEPKPQGEPLPLLPADIPQRGDGGAASRVRQLPTEDQTGARQAMDIQIATLTPNALTDGPGLRFSIHTQGCSVRCPGCQASHLWPADGGSAVDTYGLAQEALASGLPVSILGGEPMDQPEALYFLLFYLRDGRPDKGLDDEQFIILYTGYTFEQLMARSDHYVKMCLLLADVLVDGPFIAEHDHDRLQYRGSANQRVIDLRATMSMKAKEYALHGPVLIDWDTPEIILTPDGDLVAAEGLADEFAALGAGANTRRCGEVARS